MLTNMGEDEFIAYMEAMWDLRLLKRTWTARWLHRRAVQLAGLS